MSRVFGPGSRRVLAAAAAGALATGGLAGCGASSRSGPSGPAASSTATTAAATTPAPPRVSARVRAEERAIHHQVLVSLRHDSRARYGGLPADLRSRQKAPSDQVLTSTLARPADPIQGTYVRLHLGAARALVVAIGPYVPTRVQGTFDLHTPATWKVTFSHVAGRFPLSAAMFSLTDQQGQTLRPQVSTARGGPLPATVPAGSPFVVRLKSDLFSEGDGKLRYAPVGGHLLVEWDFDVETD